MTTDFDDDNILCVGVVYIYNWTQYLALTKSEGPHWWSWDSSQYLILEKSQIFDTISYYSLISNSQVPEYCTQLTEAEILNQAFNLLFAFDEIVALGYRESVNLAQVFLL